MPPLKHRPSAVGNYVVLSLFILSAVMIAACTQAEPTPDIEATVAAAVQATVEAPPSPTSTPTSTATATPTVVVPPEPHGLLERINATMAAVDTFRFEAEMTVNVDSESEAQLLSVQFEGEAEAKADGDGWAVARININNVEYVGTFTFESRTVDGIRYAQDPLTGAWEMNEGAEPGDEDQPFDALIVGRLRMKDVAAEMDFLDGVPVYRVTGSALDYPKPVDRVVLWVDVDELLVHRVQIEEHVAATEYEGLVPQEFQELFQISIFQLSGFNQPFEVTAPEVKPGAPTNIRATAGYGTATMQWEAPEHDGGSSITSYTVTSHPGGLHVTTDGRTPWVVFPGLTDDTTYIFTVTATNAVGSGAASVASESVIPTARPTPTYGPYLAYQHPVHNWSISYPIDWEIEESTTEQVDKIIFRQDIEGYIEFGFIQVSVARYIGSGDVYDTQSWFENWLQIYGNLGYTLVSRNPLPIAGWPAYEIVSISQSGESKFQDINILFVEGMDAYLVQGTSTPERWLENRAFLEELVYSLQPASVSLALPRPIPTPTPHEPLLFSVGVLPEATVGEAYRYSFCHPEPEPGLFCGGPLAANSMTTNPTGGTPHYTFSHGIGLPFGLTLNFNGVLTGTPAGNTPTGPQRFDVCATDQVGNRACQQTVINVNPQEPTPTPTPTPVTYGGSLTLNVDWERETMFGANGATGAKANMNVTFSFSDLTLEGTSNRAETKGQGSYSFTCITTGNYTGTFGSASFGGDYDSFTFKATRTEKGIELDVGEVSYQGSPRRCYLAQHLHGILNPVFRDMAVSSGPHHQDSGEAKIRESTAGVSRKPSSDCKACGCSSKHLCGLTAWNT